jgi:putative PIN family toxin of toxin-antitoxin system
VKVVLDTNVLVSALLVPRGISAQVLLQFHDGLWDLVISGAILEEYGEVLKRRRFGLPTDHVAQVLTELEIRAIRVIPSHRWRAVREDPDDNEFIDVAVEAGADFIVSGDHHLLSLKSYQGIPILTPAQFLER